MPGGKGDIGHDGPIVLYFETLAPVSAAKGAFVARAAHGDLQQDAVGFAGGADDVAFVMHFLFLQSLNPRIDLPLI
jgi:hypothetical protein